MRLPPPILLKKWAGKGISLNFSEETIRQLDALIDDFWPRGTDEDTLSVVIATMAAYVREVIIRNIGAKWVDDKKHNQPTIENRGDRVYPISEVLDRL